MLTTPAEPTGPLLSRSSPLCSSSPEDVPPPAPPPRLGATQGGLPMLPKPGIASAVRTTPQVRRASSQRTRLCYRPLPPAVRAGALPLIAPASALSPHPSPPRASSGPRLVITLRFPTDGVSRGTTLSQRPTHGAPPPWYAAQSPTSLPFCRMLLYGPAAVPAPHWSSSIASATQATTAPSLPPP